MLPVPTIPIRTRSMAIASLSHTWLPRAPLRCASSARFTRTKMCSPEKAVASTVARWQIAPTTARQFAACPNARTTTERSSRRDHRRGALVPRGLRRRRPALGDPTIHARIDDRLYLHGAVANHMLKSLVGGVEACVTITLVDALVLARSQFHHSMNYRSVMIFGRAMPVDERRREGAPRCTRSFEHVCARPFRRRPAAQRLRTAARRRCSPSRSMSLGQGAHWAARSTTRGPRRADLGRSAPRWPRRTDRLLPSRRGAPNVAAQFGGVGRPGVGGTAGHHVLDERVQRGALLADVVDRHRAPEDHHRSVVHRVVELRAGQHERVDERDGPRTLRLRPRAISACGWPPPVEVETVVDPRVNCRDHPGPAVDGESPRGTRAPRR